MKATTWIQPRPVRAELEELSRTIRAERDRVTGRPGDRTRDCEHFVTLLHKFYGQCDATSLYAAVDPMNECPQTCPCFRRRP
jgi:hypothetical protein